jgi:N-acetylglucosaminyldiphosphoundecaprenol N-acetyl-beta-D-mannosaminyltransferase
MLTRVDVLGTVVTVGPLAAVADEAERWIARRERGFICLANVHVVETARRTPALAGALRRARLVVADGAPVAWTARALGAASAPRIAGNDIFDELCRRSIATGYRHFLLGSTPATLERFEQRVRERYPGLVICGTHSPPFAPVSPAAVDAQCALVNAAQPDVVWVGLGAPKQEAWMDLARVRLDAPVVIGVGAVFDFVAGTKPRAPRVLQRLGLEWAHRLAHEPRRLAGRYLTTNTRFLLAIAGVLLRRATRGRRT